MFQDAMMSAQVFKTCPSSEMPWERWSDWNYEVQKKSHPIQARHDRLSSRRLHLFAPHPPTAPWANLRSWRDVDKKLSTFSFTHLSTNCLTQTPQMLKKNPLSLSSLAPSSSASDGFLQRARLVLTTRQTVTKHLRCAWPYGDASSGYKITLTELLLCIQHCTKHFPCINSFNPCNNSLEYVLSSFYRKRNWKHRE